MSYWADLLHAALEVAQGASGLLLLIGGMWVVAARDERHARARGDR